MEEALDDGEFWLPPRFLADDDLLLDEGEVNDTTPKDWVLFNSPESTHRGSSNCQSRVSSPPDKWALLCSAAEEAARVQLKEESFGGFNNKGLLVRPPKKPPSLPLRATQFQQVEKSQVMVKQQNPQVWGGKKQHHQQHLVLQNSANRPSGLFPAACPPMQQQPHHQIRSGMQAVFLGNPTGKRECGGTGVFLPRRISTAEPRKKQARPTVLLPARVVQALNLNLDDINAQPQLRSRFNVSITTDGGKKNFLGNNLT